MNRRCSVVNASLFLNLCLKSVELKRVIDYKRFTKRLSTIGSTPDEVFAYFMNLSVFVPSPKFIPEKIIEDTFDNLFLALASENKAHLIISGDNHLLDIKEYNHIQIVTPSEACKVIEIGKGWSDG
ncbi:MAG: putative toxin-antitoxin system toxin component, PIN family [Deltaproteobacteria bacterium]|nr:putative toxin-antitoxin system toxin component, PIN family [Deltaproteobacteria bacterium]